MLWRCNLFVEDGISLNDRIRNEETHRMAGTSEDVTVRMKKMCSAGLGTSKERIKKEWRKRFEEDERMEK